MANSFRKPNITLFPSPTFGLPRGTFGRGIYAPQAIVLHALRVTLDEYDALTRGIAIRNRAEIRHPSCHYAIDYSGACHQYVEDADIAWSFWDADMQHFPSAFPAGAWSFLTTYPGVSPDNYVLNVAVVSGEVGGQLVTPPTATPFPPAMLVTTARLIAWLCHTYTIPCDTTHIVPHSQIDLQFARICPGDDYPYALVLAAAQQIVNAGGEPPDDIFSFQDWQRFFGPFRIDFSFISSAAYVDNP